MLDANIQVLSSVAVEDEDSEQVCRVLVVFDSMEEESVRPATLGGGGGLACNSQIENRHGNGNRWRSRTAHQFNKGIASHGEAGVSQLQLSSYGASVFHGEACTRGHPLKCRRMCCQGVTLAAPLKADGGRLRLGTSLDTTNACVPAGMRTRARATQRQPQRATRHSSVNTTSPAIVAKLHCTPRNEIAKWQARLSRLAPFAKMEEAALVQLSHHLSQGALGVQPGSHLSVY